MRVLIVRMSSLGDVLHTLPAVTDAHERVSGIRFDWVVEEAFAEIPGWHAAVDRTIALSLRKWRRGPGLWPDGEMRDALRDLRRVQYDRIIDAQGLYKSAAIACLARGERSGYARDSAREPLAARTYAQRISAPPGLHAIERCRSLFAGTLGYAVPRGDPDYGLSRDRFPAVHASSRPYLVFNHASTWPTKSWPRPYWNELLERAARQGLRVLLPWGNAVERGQSERLARRHDNADVLPELTLEQLAGVLANAAAVVSVDTGPGHLTAALGTPGISIYGATDPALTGTVGKNQHHVEARFSCAPCLSRRCGYAGSAQVAPACYATVSPDRVWGTLTHILNKGDT